MPFPWLHASVPMTLRKTFAERALAAQRREIADRATILMHLGLARDQAAARCRQNLVWEFELQARPAVLSEVNKLVADVFKRKAK